jgi:NhaC family Na+:H+ antiporter
MNTNKGNLHFKEAVFILLLILAIIFTSLFVLKTEPHLALLNCIVIVCFLGLIKRHSWKELESGMVKGIQSGI